MGNSLGTYQHNFLLVAAAERHYLTVPLWGANVEAGNQILSDRAFPVRMDDPEASESLESAEHKVLAYRFVENESIRFTLFRDKT